MLSRRPFLLVLSAPSGAGKTTLCRALVRHDPHIRYSVSVTTRPKRGKEVDAEDYIFLGEDEFKKMMESDALLEWAEVYGYYYGTPRKRVEELLSEGFDVVFALDIKGALRLKELYPESATVFLLPPTLAELRHRLTLRGRDNREIIEQRLAQARSEIARARDFDYVIVNDSLAQSVHLLTSILEAERCLAKRITSVNIMEDR